MPKRILTGQVVSDKTDKTISVEVQRRFRHPTYKKYVTKSKKYLAHDPENSAKIGETVSIQECRPLSKNKSWVLLAGKEASS